jgi:LysM repeat protein
MKKRAFIYLFMSLHLCAWSQSTQTELIVSYSGTNFFIETTVEPGLTVYKLSKQYGISVDSFWAANPTMENGSLRLGQEISIPISKSQISQQKLDDKAFPVYYEVKSQENMFRIARVYLGVKEEIVMLLNHKENTNLNIGERLLLGYFRAESVENHELIDEHIASAGSTMKEKFEFRAAKKVFKDQTGVGLWFKDTDPGSGMFVLHESAPINSVVAVTNPMFRKTVYAKVIGNIPPKTYPKEVIIVVSPEVAKSLGVLDARFFAKIKVEVLEQ